MSTIKVLGRECVEVEVADKSCRCWWSDRAVGVPRLQVVEHRPGCWSLSVSLGLPRTDDAARRTVVAEVWDCQTPDDAAFAWLQAASEEAPALCNAVLDGMCEPTRESSAA